MAHREDDDEEDWNDDRWEEDESAADGETTQPCPHCGAEIYDDSEYCPRCERYLSREEQRTSSQPQWVVVTAVVCLVVFLWLIVRGWL